MTRLYGQLGFLHARMLGSEARTQFFGVGLGLEELLLLFLHQRITADRINAQEIISPFSNVADCHGCLHLAYQGRDCDAVLVEI